MAAIISQMAANKRLRQKGLSGLCVSSDKCVYSLPPFDRCFDPRVHNKYVRAMEQRRRIAEREQNRAGGGRSREQQLPLYSSSSSSSSPDMTTAKATAKGGYHQMSVDATVDETGTTETKKKEKKRKKKRKAERRGSRRQSKSADDELFSEILSGLAILALGLCVIVGLVVYVWIALWEVGPAITSSGGGGNGGDSNRADNVSSSSSYGANHRNVSQKATVD